MTTALLKGMDIIENLSTDFDHLRDLTADLLVAPETNREAIFRQLVRLQDVSLKAQTSAIESMDSDLEELESAQQKLLERSDVMEELANSIYRTNHALLRDAKIELYADLVLQRIHDGEREILPAIYDQTDVESRLQLGAEYEKYKSIALDPSFHTNAG